MIKALKRAYYIMRPAETSLHLTWQPCPEKESDKMIKEQVCHACSNGDGPVICGTHCVCYDVCKIGQEYVRRGIW